MTDAISAQGLRKKLGKTRALDGLSISAPQGSVVGLLGPNGAGKTTSVRILATLLRPDAGHVEICGIDALAQHQRVRGIIGFLVGFVSSAFVPSESMPGWLRPFADNSPVTVTINSA